MRHIPNPIFWVAVVLSSPCDPEGTLLGCDYHFTSIHFTYIISIDLYYNSTLSSSLCVHQLLPSCSSPLSSHASHFALNPLGCPAWNSYPDNRDQDTITISTTTVEKKFRSKPATWMSNCVYVCVDIIFMYNQLGCPIVRILYLISFLCIYYRCRGNVKYNGLLPEYFITFHLHYITFALHYICI